MTKRTTTVAAGSDLSPRETVEGLRASLRKMIDANEAYFTAVKAGGLSPEQQRALIALRDAEDFFHQAALELVGDGGIAGATTYFRYAIMKAVEFNAMLPDNVRGDLTRDCFRRKPRSGQRRGLDPVVAAREAEGIEAGA